MSLQSYKKAPIKNKEISHEEVRDLLIIKKKQKDEVKESSLWKNISSSYHKFLKNYSGSRWIGLIVPSIFILLGIILLITQITPQILAFIQTNILNNSLSPISAVNENYYKDKLAYISSPQSGYFSEIISSSNFGGTDTVSSNYKGSFYLDIPKINTVHAKVTANVKSDIESTYKPILESSLAHFAGTPIPGQNGNVFIYGHSIDPTVYRYDPNNPVVEFTKLGGLNTGDKIYVEMDTKKIEYTVSQIKIINPTDTNVLDNKGGKTLTLMTCYPFGNNAKRLIVIARQED
ncbi:MAG: sortase [bacterium]